MAWVSVPRYWPLRSSGIVARTSLTRPRALVSVAAVFVLTLAVYGFLFAGELDITSWLALTSGHPQAETRILGDVPGFVVMQNVWFRNDTFYMYAPSTRTKPPEKDRVFSDPTRLVRFQGAPPPAADTTFPGATVWINENGTKGWHGLYHYYHFAAENLLAGFGALAMAGADPPTRLIIPWEEGWHDMWGMNDMVAEGIFTARGSIIGPSDFAALGQEGTAWLFFEQVVFVDRWASHRHNPEVEVWYKMSIRIFDHPPPPGFFESARQNLLETYEIAEPPPHKKLPRVTYIDRQDTSRRMSDETHVRFLQVLETMQDEQKIEFRHMRLEKYPPVVQVDYVAWSDVLIGIHGNGLTHEMWLPINSTLVEIFPDGSFLKDYQSIAFALGHDYIALHKDSLLHPAVWQNEPGQRLSEQVYNGTEIELDADFFRATLQKVLEQYVGPPPTTLPPMDD